MKYISLAALLFAACATLGEAQAACPPAGYTRAQLEALKASDWTIADDAARNALARAMTDCLASPDPALRDVPYEALQHWMRGRLLSDATMLAIGDDLQARLTAPEGTGVERPFAALVLAEVARADRIQAYLTPARRASLLDASINFLTNVRDYRGFDDREGWRHGVAHGSDLMLQLTLNPAFGKPELTRIRDAIATQIAPAGHFYIYGESERLATPIVYMAQRGLFSEAEWTAWLAQVSAPAPLASWGDAFTHNSDIARVHNVKAFIQTIYVYANLDSSAADDVLSPGARAAILALP
jgi:Protein of unknown function (DUF2785)